LSKKNQEETVSISPEALNPSDWVLPLSKEAIFMPEGKMERFNFAPISFPFQV
jgi:hypothetical protein